MNRRHVLAVYLAEAAAQVERGNALVLQQRNRILQLTRDQRDTTSAAVVLGYLERELARHVADRDQLTDEIAGLGPRRIA